MPTIPHDKALHILAGLLVYIATVAVLAVLLPGYSTGPLGLLGVLAAALAGAIKELADMAANADAKDAGQPPPHSVEVADLLFTLAGGLLGWLAASAPQLAQAMGA